MQFPTTAILVLISLITVLGYKKYKTLHTTLTHHQDHPEEASTSGEVMVNKTLYDNETMSKVKQLKDNNSIGEDSTTTNVPMHESQHGQFNPSATISH